MYVLDRQKFRKLLKEQGFSSVQAFAQKSAIHRNTLNAYMSGKKSVFSAPMEKIATTLKIDPVALAIQSDFPGLSDLRNVLRSVIQGRSDRNLAFLLFGSRAEKRERPFSDWDVGVTGGEQKVTSSEYLRIKTEVSDLVEDFPYGVDLVNLDQAPTWFLQEITPGLAHLAGSFEAFQFFKGVLHAAKSFDKVA